MLHVVQICLKVFCSLRTNFRCITRSRELGINKDMYLADLKWFHRREFSCNFFNEIPSNKCCVHLKKFCSLIQTFEHYFAWWWTKNPRNWRNKVCMVFVFRDRKKLSSDSLPEVKWNCYKIYLLYMFMFNDILWKGHARKGSGQVSVHMYLVLTFKRLCFVYLQKYVYHSLSAHW